MSKKSLFEEQDAFAERGKNLEEAFFRHKEVKLLQILEEERSHHQAIVDLSSLSGIKEQYLLDIAVNLGINTKTFPALGLVPLFMIAWSDDIMDETEQTYILNLARQQDIAPNSECDELLKCWFATELNTNLFLTWAKYIQALKKSLTPNEFETVKRDLVSHARFVARGSGGILGIGGISKIEKELIQKIADVLDS